MPKFSELSPKQQRKERAKRAHCRSKQSFAKQNTDKTCVSCACKGQKRSCLMYPHDPHCCPPGQESNHVMPVHLFMPPGQRKAENSAKWRARAGAPSTFDRKRYKGCEGYQQDFAPCLCVKPDEHKKMDNAFYKAEDKAKTPPNQWSYAEAKTAAVRAVRKARPHCSPECLKAQLDATHERMGINDKTTLRADSKGKSDPKIPVSSVPASAIWLD
jgi:hypothetical protein